MNHELKLLPYLIFILLSSCNKNNNNDFVIIEGNVKNIPGHKIYISKHDEPEEFLDSAFYNGKKFTFKIKKENEFKEPFLAKLSYKDFKKKHQPLFFKYDKSNVDVFMFEHHDLKIKGDIKKNNALSLKGGPQNKVLNSFQSFISFGDIPEGTSDKKSYVLTYNKIIKQNPSSYFLINNVYEYKNKYTDSELTFLFNSFSKKVQTSTAGKGILNYIRLRTKPGRPFMPVSFKDSAGILRKVEYHQARINVIVFWSSGCKPCREEIPTLQELNKKFKDQGVEFYSISTDEKDENWKKALAEEQMEWNQFIIDGDDSKKRKEEHKKIQTVFNVYEIPMLIITDYNGKELERKVGYYKDFDYEGMLKKYVKS